jgi:glycosyltransferase involved in cell wall biosynthesis
MKISHIICTRNRADQLSVTLAKFNTALMAAHQIELVLLDGESTDDTPKVMADFAEKYKRTKIVRAGKGLGRAHNAGIEAAKGDLIAFTDDDCYLDDNYYTALRLQFAEPCQHHYGMGQILLFDEEDDCRIANATISRLVTSPPKTVLPTGTFQGANIFFLREVFEKAGKFRDDMGSGTPFPCEDIEFGTRASLAGFTVMFSPPPLSVLERLEREFRGAADYIRYRLDVGDTPGKEKPRTPDAGQPSVETPSPKRAQGSKA